MAKQENEVTAKVVDINEAQKPEMDLSTVRIWNDEVKEYVRKKYADGTRHVVTIVESDWETYSEVKVVTEDGVQGSIEIEELCWTKHYAEPGFKAGDKVEMIVKGVNTTMREIEFTMLGFTESPWPKLANEFTVGSKHKGFVYQKLQMGAIIHLKSEILNEEVEAWIPSSNLIGDAKEKVVEKETVTFAVERFDKDKREIILAYVDENAKDPSEINTKYLDVPFLYDLMSVPTYSRYERRMQTYIINWARKHNVDIKSDKKGNLYLTKGTLEEGEFYPCVTSHMDTVQEKAKVYSEAGARLEILTRNKKVYTDKDKKFYGGEYKHEIYVDGMGIGADDKGGVFISLSLMEHFDKIKAAFFVEEEIGMLGSKEMDKSFFDDCGYCIGWDSPDLNRAAYKSSGVKLFSAEFYREHLKGVCDEWGLTDFRSEPFTDISIIREKTKLMCMNFGNGGYEAHCYTEYSVIEDMDHALGMGIAIIDKLGRNLYKSLPTTATWLNGIRQDEVVDPSNKIKEKETDDDTYFSRTFGYSYGGYSNTQHTRTTSGSSGSNSSSNTNTSTSQNDKTKDDSIAVKYVIDTYEQYIEDIKTKMSDVLKEFCKDNGIEDDSALMEKVKAVYSKEVKF